MLLVVDQIRLPFVKSSPFHLKKALSRRLGVSPSKIRKISLLKRSTDARDKDRMIYFVFKVLVEVKGLSSVPEGVKAYKKQEPLRFKKCRSFLPVVVGTGPCGLFCALALNEAGVRGIVLERGCQIGERVKRVERLWSEGVLDSECNPQFGEGGAGTFSDGKLTTRIRDPRISWVFEQLVRFGAPEEILYEAKPHVGTDRLREVVKNIRRFLEESGWEVAFRCRLEDVVLRSGRLHGVVANGDFIRADVLVLAIGHSARDTYEMLYKRGFAVVPKPFAVGFRIEHPQRLIDEAQYGKWAGHPMLPPASYQLAVSYKREGRGVYTFCMCPGGFIICASSHEGKVVTNGMSYFGRDSGYANSAVVVTVDERDFGDAVFGGVRFQERLEEAVYNLAGGYRAVGQSVGSFVYGKGTLDVPFCTYRPGVVEYPLDEVLPERLCEFLKEGLRYFGRKIKGFDREGVVVAPETRTSAPVRILRGEDMQAVGIEGVYPAGEGAGYAGGIVSSAVDGIKVAGAVVEKYALD